MALAASRVRGFRAGAARVLGATGVRAFVCRARDVGQTAVDKYRLRRAVRRRPLRIVIGASGLVPAGWTRTEQAYVNLLDAGSWDQFFAPHSIDAMLAEHVWEHLTLEEGVAAAKTCMRYLKSGGYLRLAVPDGNHPDESYVNHVKPGGAGSGAEDHKVLYDYKLLSRTIAEAGFKIELLEYFDEKGRFTFNDWTPSDGMVHRSSRYDERNRDGRLNYTSLIIDARSP